MSSKKGDLIIEGKTKSVYHLIENKPTDGQFVLVENKDKITAFDGTRAHDLEGKAAISNATNAKVFEFLNLSGIKTSFVHREGETSYVARRCNMILIEWVTRRIATGSFLRRNPGVKEGYRFGPPKMETFLKDDANNDPQWSMEQILENEMEVGGVKIGKAEYDFMAKTTVTVFEVLERAWLSLDCALVDMKIEFGVDVETGEILLSDVIDSDSWRLWPGADKRLMKDKQCYRNLKTVTAEGLDMVKRNFKWVSDKLDSFIPKSQSLVVILMGSGSDAPHCEKIKEHCVKLGLNVETVVTSAHKTTQDTLNVVAEYEKMGLPAIVLIAVAGRSNGLGPVVSGNSTFPVINCPPWTFAADLNLDVWSSLRTPSGLDCGTVLYPEAAAQSAAKMLALSDHVIWAKLRAKQLQLWSVVKDANKKL